MDFIIPGWSFDVAAGPPVWKKLPASVRLTEDLGYFKRLLKAHFVRLGTESAVLSDFCF